MGFGKALSSEITKGLASSLLSGTTTSPPTPLTVDMRKGLIDGDSLSSSQNWATPTAFSLERRPAGYFVNFAAQTYQVSNIRYNRGYYGTSGHSASQIQSGLAAGVSYAESADVDDVFLHLGTNDVEGVETIANLQVIYQDIISQYANCTAAPFVWVGLCGPRGDFEGYTALERAGFITRLHDIRAAITAAAAAVGIPSRVHVWDAWNYLVDPAIINADTGLAYFPKAGYYNADGVHFIHKGAHWCAKALKEKYMSALNLTNPTTLPSTSGAYNTNPSLAGTGGTGGTGISGSIADNCSVVRNSGSAITAVCSKETATIFGVSQTTQKIVIANATAATEEIWFHAEWPNIQKTFDNTTGVEVVVPMKIEALPVGFLGCYLYIQYTVGGSNYINRDLSYVSTNSLPDDDPAQIEYLMRTEPLLIPTGTSTNARILVRMLFAGTTPGNGATVWIGQPTAKMLAP